MALEMSMYNNMRGARPFAHGSGSRSYENIVVKLATRSFLLHPNFILNSHTGTVYTSYVALVRERHTH